MPSSTRRRRAGFSLVELLVVIGIIMVVISLLLPSLAGAKKQARTVQCLANLKQIATAQEMYASQWDGAAVPVFLYPKANRIRWQNNNQFRTYLSQPPLVASDPKYKERLNRYSVGMICPDAGQSIARADEYGAPIQLSYGYNVFQATVAPEGAGGPQRTYRGFHKTKIKNPTRKLMFIDSMGGQVHPDKSGDHGEPGYDESKDPDDDGYVHYRHGKKADKANVLFWDGHSETLGRTAIDAEADPQNNLIRRSLWNATRD